jgi:hypothetical protein
VGYNPRKRGRPPYYPLVCFEGHTKDFWHGELRPGGAHCHGGGLFAAGMLRQAARYGASVKGSRRPRFYHYKVVRTIEAPRGKFLIVAKLTKPLRTLVTGVTYVAAGHGVAVAECQYQPHRWRRPYRFVIVR